MYGCEDVVIRPPSEADSLLLKVAYGCSHNKCAFCGTYRHMRFRPKELDRILAEIDEAAKTCGDARRVFLADGDAMCLPMGVLAPTLDRLAERLPRLRRVGIYANARDILAKSPEELRTLRSKRLGVAYVGLESGDDEVLRRMRKGATAGEMVEAVRKAQEAGIKCSVIALLGLAGKGEASRRHAELTGRAAGRMEPRFFSVLTYMPLENTPLGRAVEKGEFELLSPEESLRELRVLVENLDVKGTVFRADHASNYLPIGGNLPKDKGRILRDIDACLRGETPVRPESLRGL